MPKENISARFNDGKIELIHITVASPEQLENAIWLRENKAGLIASALHGGQAKGFHIAISDIPTTDIRTILENTKGK